MKTEPSQNVRVLNALRSGPVRQTDFDPPTIDGFKPIRRVAARVEFLKNHEGHQIEASRATNGTAIYTLVREGHTAEATTAREFPEGTSSTVVSAVPAPLEALFDVPDPIVGLAHYQADRAA